MTPITVARSPRLWARTDCHRSTSGARAWPRSAMPMPGRPRRLGIVGVVALAAGLSGCALAGLLPSKDDSARLHQQAQAALARWAAAVAAAGGQSAFVPVGDLTAQVGDWEEAV